MTEPVAPPSTETSAGKPAPSGRRVVILADDLIWATRLSDAITAAGASPQRTRRLEDLARLLSDADAADGPAADGMGGFAIIDLTARAYDGIEAIRLARDAGARVVAVGQHDDVPLRQAALEATDAAALLIGVGADLRYLTGYSAHALERLTMLVVPMEGRTSLVAPRLEAMAARACPAAEAGLLDVVAWDETDDPYRLIPTLLPGVGPEARLLVDPGLPARHLLALQRVLPAARFGLATEVMRDLRIRKSPYEIDALRRAAHAADRVVAQIAAGRLVGRTEADVSREVRERLVAEGHAAASFAIVASGPNGASPHHEADARVIEAGDPIVLDIGGTLDGYGSDITRMLWVTGGDPDQGPTPEFLEVFELVRAAQSAATDAVRPGVGCGELDEVARGIIRAGGLGDAFIHRLGHGIGLEAHEEPYLVAGNAEELATGHAFSIEPGVYLEGRFGVRIEDIVVCAADGPDILNLAPHELLVVNG